MGRLTLLCSSVIAAIASPASADQFDRWAPLLNEAALRFGLPEAWIRKARVTRSPAAHGIRENIADTQP